MAGTAAKRPCRPSRPQRQVFHSMRRHAAQFTVVRKAHSVSLSHTYVVHSPYTELAHAPQKHFAQALAGLVALRPHLQNASSKIEQSMHTCGPARARENSLRLCRAWCSSARLGKSPNCQNRLCSHRLARINSLPDHVQPRTSARMPRPENALSSLRAHHKAAHSPHTNQERRAPQDPGHRAARGLLLRPRQLFMYTDKYWRKSDPPRHCTLSSTVPQHSSALHRTLELFLGRRARIYGTLVASECPQRSSGSRLRVCWLGNAMPCLAGGSGPMRARYFEPALPSLNW
jgi:hypothetical protein